MTTFHMIIGTLVVVLYLVNLGMYAMNFVRGKSMPYHRAIAMGAATFLLLQYLLGFSLLGEGKSIPAMHVVLALLTILPVGAEHMLTAKEEGMRRRGMIGMLATFMTLVLVLIAYMIGELNT